MPRASGKGIKRTIEQATGATSGSAPAQTAAQETTAPEASAPDPSAPGASALQAGLSEASRDAAAPAEEGTGAAAEEPQPQGDQAANVQEFDGAQQQPGVAAQSAEAADSVLQAGSDAVQSTVQVG